MDSKCQGSIEDNDNFWDDEAHQDNLNTNSVLDLDREWQARYKQFHTVGYREGLLAGKETSAQLGFNNGFKESVLVGYNFGKVRGITSLFAILPEHVKGKLVETSEGRTKLEALHGKVSSMSGKDALKLFHEDVLKGGVEAKTSKSKDNSQVDLEGNLQTLKIKEHIGSSSNTSITSELADLHRQLVSMLENTSLKAAC